MTGLEQRLSTLVRCRHVGLSSVFLTYITLTVDSVITVLLFWHISNKKNKQHDKKWFHPKTAFYWLHFRAIRFNQHSKPSSQHINTDQHCKQGQTQTLCALKIHIKVPNLISRTHTLAWNKNVRNTIKLFTCDYAILHVRCGQNTAWTHVLHSGLIIETGVINCLSLNQVQLVGTAPIMSQAELIVSPSLPERSVSPGAIYRLSK